MQSPGFWGQFRSGLKAYTLAFRFLRIHGLRHGYIVVLAGAFATMKFVGWVLGMGADRLEFFVFDRLRRQGIYPADDTLSALSDGVFQGMDYGVEGMVFLLRLWIQFKITKFIVLFFLSPVFALYAELVAQKAGVDRPAEKGLAWSMWRGIKSASLLIAMELMISFILFLMLGVMPLVFPPLTLFAWGALPILSAAVSAWFYGAALLDLSWDRNGFGVRDSLRASIRHSGAVLALGLPFFGAMGIPAIGWLTGPVLGGLMGTVGAVLYKSKRAERT
jgi:hypothetical protein